MIIELGVVAAFNFFLAKFIGSRIKFKVHTATLILICAIVWFLTLLLMSYYLYKVGITGSSQGRLAGPPSILAAITFFWGFKQGHKPKEKPKKEDPIKPILNIFDETKGSVNSIFFDDFVEKLKLKVIKEKDEILKSIVESGKTPRVWVHRILAIELGEVLQNGELHVYRGVLNGAGTELLKAFDIMLNKLVEIQDMTAENASADKEAVREGIRLIG